VALDFIVKLPISQGFDSILTVTDQGCTKAAIFIHVMRILQQKKRRHSISNTCLPTSAYQQKVISDRDPRFMSKFMQEACKVTGIKHAPSTAYHPRTDRQSERSNQWLETAIRFITDQKQKNWAPYLPICHGSARTPSERTQMEKIRDLKSLARQYARDRGSCDDTRISYLEYVESEAEADWTLARMIAG
jgi:hypothetical protein